MATGYAQDGMTLREALKTLRIDMASADYRPGGVGPRLTLDDGRQLWVRLKDADGGGSLAGVWVAELLGADGLTVRTYDL